VRRFADGSTSVRRGGPGPSRPARPSSTCDAGPNDFANDGTTHYNRTPEGALLALGAGTTKQLAVTDQHTDLVAGLTPDG
jgi:hypothetical protein